MTPKQQDTACWSHNLKYSADC